MSSIQASTHHSLGVAASVAAALLAAVSLWGQGVSSETFRVTGSSTPAAAAGSHNAEFSVFQIVGQADAFGVSSGEVGTVGHGARIPPAVENLLHYALDAGWSLIASPGISDSSAGDIFTGSAGAPIKVGTIQYQTDDGDRIESEDADPLVAQRPFWIFSYWGGTSRSFRILDPPAPVPSGHWTEPLREGWTLYGPPYHVTVPPYAEIAAVWGWDSQKEHYQLMLPGSVLSPLKGYWVYKRALAP